MVVLAIWLSILNHTIIWICPSVCLLAIFSTVRRPIDPKLGRPIDLEQGICRQFYHTIIYHQFVRVRLREEPHWQGASTCKTKNKKHQNSELSNGIFTENSSILKMQIRPLCVFINHRCRQLLDISTWHYRMPMAALQMVRRPRQQHIFFQCDTAPAYIDTMSLPVM